MAFNRVIIRRVGPLSWLLESKSMNKGIPLVLSIIALSSCATKSHKPADIHIYYEFGDDTYWSDANLYTRNMCREANKKIDLQLSPAELDAIGVIANSSGFFDLPDNVSRDYEGVCSGVLTYNLNISYNGKANSVYWESACVQDEKYPKQVSVIAGALEEALQKTSKIRSLPPSECSRY